MDISDRKIVDQELIAKFTQELQSERANSSTSGNLPAKLREFLDDQPFQVCFVVT